MAGYPNQMPNGITRNIDTPHKKQEYIRRDIERWARRIFLCRLDRTNRKFWQDKFTKEDKS